MASLQQKTTNGQKYWYIVESRRVNGKPRPVVLAYLGKAENLLRRLQGIGERVKVKSFSHGCVAALLDVAQKLEVPSVINKYVQSPRDYIAAKPVRNHLTVGMTLLLGAVGRVCLPRSKRAWWDWAKTTSCEYLLRVGLSKVDSQHFWDMMDALPVAAIAKVEEELLQKVRECYSLETDTLFYDTTNFFTFIATTNMRCTIAQRGKNKQKRHDLRQVGLAMVVTRKDLIPIFHLTYQGNRHDSKVFREILGAIKNRTKALGFDLEKHTLVFDRGNNSKRNMALVAKSKLHYVGALTPYHHQGLVKKAMNNFQPARLDDESLEVYRAKESIWGEKRTVVVFVSDRLKAGQLRGIYKSLEKKEKKLEELQQSLREEPGKNTSDRVELEDKISRIVKGQFINNVIRWRLKKAKGRFKLSFKIDEKELAKVEDKLGFRILMTDRHDWSAAEIIKAFHGQAAIELAFKNVKNPYHLTLKPQHHWTDQKIAVHNFMCVLGYLLAALVWREAREKAEFKGTLNTLLDKLNNIRLATLIEKTDGPSRPKTNYQLEEMSDEETQLMETLGIAELHIKRPKFEGLRVYK